MSTPVQPEPGNADDRPGGTETEGLAVMVEFARGDVVGELGRDGTVEERLVVIALYLRLVSSAEAILTLLRGGHGREAFLLTRTTAEAAIDLLWALVTGDTGELVVGYARYRRWLLAQTAQDHPELFGPAPKVELDPGEPERHQRTYGPRGRDGWTGNSVGKRVEAVRADGRFDNVVVRQVFVLMLAANAEVHPDIASMARRMRWHEHDGRRHLIGNFEPEELLSPLAAPTAAVHLLLALKALHDELNLPADRLAHAWATAASHFGDDWPSYLQVPTS